MDNQPEFDKEWLEGALSACAAELDEMLKKNAIDDAPAEESEGSEGPTDASAADETSANGDPTSPDAADAAPDAAPEMSGAPDMAPEGSAPPAPDDGTIAPAPTVEALMAEYAALDPEALKMHFMAAKQALMAAMGPDASAPPGAPPAPGAPPMAPPAAAPPQPMAMSEKVWNTKLAKSEAASQAKIVELETLVKSQTEAVVKLVEALHPPQRKSVKGISDLAYVAHPGEQKPSLAKNMDRNQVKAALSVKVREGKLSKSEKDLVISFDAGSVDISKIEHLLAK